MASTELSTTTPLASRTRAQILTYLASAGVVTDPSGHANRKLRDALGFSGSTGAFTQMLAAMDQGQLIERHVRGRRTYSIQLGPAAGVPSASPQPQTSFAPQGAHSPGEGLRTANAGSNGGERNAGEEAAAPRESAVRELEGALDYDELASSLLKAVARTLAGRLGGEERPAGGAGMAQRKIVNLERTVASLERELAKLRAEKGELAERNNQLQAQVSAAEHNLEVLGQRSGRRRPDARARLDDEDAQLLRRLTRKLPDGESGLTRPASTTAAGREGGVPGWPRRV